MNGLSGGKPKCHHSTKEVLETSSCVVILPYVCFESCIEIAVYFEVLVLMAFQVREYRAQLLTLIPTKLPHPNKCKSGSYNSSACLV